jgi:hypothetical protein
LRAHVDVTDARGPRFESQHVGCLVDRLLGRNTGEDEE